MTNTKLPCLILALIALASLNIQSTSVLAKAPVPRTRASRNSPKSYIRKRKKKVRRGLSDLGYRAYALDPGGIQQAISGHQYELLAGHALRNHRPHLTEFQGDQKSTDVILSEGAPVVLRAAGQ